MSYSIHESISKPSGSPVYAFVASIESSILHWHEEYEMIGVLKGCIEVRVQSELITLCEKDLLLINSNKIHALKVKSEQPCICMIVQMDTSLFGAEEEEFLFYLDSTKKSAPSCRYDLFFKRMARIVREAMKEEKHALYRLRAEACTLIADLFEYTIYDVCYRSGVFTDEREFVVSFINYVQDHLEDERILETSCHRLGISRKTLDRNVKAFLGMSSKELIDSLRLEKAKKLLKNTGKNMGYIIDACGFGSETSFYRIFREKTGLTPKAFREMGSMEHYDGKLKGYLDFEVPFVKELLEDIIEDKR